MKKLTGFILCLYVYLSLVPSVFAANVNICPISQPPFSQLCVLRLQDVVRPLITTIFIIAIIAALLYLIWGGFKWLTSGGDKAAVQAAREHIIAAVVGLIIMFSVYVILFLILGFFSIGTGTFTLPSI